MSRLLFLIAALSAAAVRSQETARPPALPDGALSGIEAPAFDAAPVKDAPPRYDYGASVAVSREDIEDGTRFEEVSRQLFDAYLAHERIGGVGAMVARRKFAAVAPWNLEFARGHADGLTLSFETARIAGKRRFAQKTAFRYNGRDVTVYRYRDGFQSASSVFIDGKEAKDAGGEPLQFFTKDRETYDGFVKWFEGELGAPRRGGDAPESD